LEDISWGLGEEKLKHRTRHTERRLRSEQMESLNIENL
jgi:hypothetical protein